MNTAPLVETTDLSFRFGERPVLHGLGLAVPAGSIYGFLGPNGAGKSTTLRLLLGLLRPGSGTVRLFGHELARHRVALLSRVGALIENPSLYDHLTGHENVEATRRLRGLAPARTAAVLAQVGLSAAAHRPVKGYSLGMKQRLGLALALLPDPDLLILDEPTNGLDPAGISDLRLLLRQLREEHGKTILLSSHLIGEVEKVVTHVGVIQQGQLVFQGSLAEMQARQHTRAQLVLETACAATCRRLLPELHEATVAAPGTLRVPFHSREHTAALASALVAAGQPVFGLHCEQPTLEDTFLHLTETTAAQ
ncbi:ATP-binding cassette domain-containing protein [Hymenobacter armeniacus]|uniref:ATP-binding cassette domain-containing protein n=1 Tax=Hymenobacter armeniacus TaxID=2771358 RepID=A0ABR8JVI3_9BACT|nr:ATP-binding cassette domain-containing protein [Hymenobacter armeniacus]MBD2722791.1 ATP-binding cassette domain-containing protein [Hymenobacter armeniacus]